jgi:glycolate oxidase iron-sulfur subunit
MSTVVDQTWLFSSHDSFVVAGLDARRYWYAPENMKHSIALAAHGPFGDPMARAVQTCVHCGFCLPTCPTYQVLGQEMDSPRGRIVLMKEVLEKTLPLEKALPHIDACLGCLACETSCPSGVHYRDLISPFRALSEDRRDRRPTERLKRFALLHTLPYPWRFRLAVALGRLAQPLSRLLPVAFRPMLTLLPKKLPASEPLQPVYRPASAPRARVALLAGCVQQALAPEINTATIEVLVRNGVEVLVPRHQGCCGALAWHIGEAGDARDKAAQNLAAFPVAGLDAIVTNAAGCGSGLREYPLMLRGTRLETAADQFAAKVRDVAEFLDQLGLESPPAPERPLTVAYQDACHLAHGQNVRRQPRRLLEQIPGLKIRELADPDICCGSAGTYNLDQPAIAAELGRRKAAAIVATGADYVASGNIGCLTQLQTHLPREWATRRLAHTVVLLARAYRGQL